MNILRNLWHRGLDLLPVEGFQFDRPIVVFQSDDWGRAGLRDREGLQQLAASGVVLGERPYDFYTLETAEDLAALRAVLRGHHDSVGRSPSLEMNFMVANLDLQKMDLEKMDFGKLSAEGSQQIPLLPLAEGFPAGRNRPGPLEAYREGVQEGLFYPALHGMTHFCLPAVERDLADSAERGNLLRTLWKAGTPYIHWRMPWIGYEYWDPEASPDDRFLPADTQRDLIGKAGATSPNCSPHCRARLARPATERTTIRTGRGRKSESAWRRTVPDLPSHLISIVTDYCSFTARWNSSRL